MYRTDDTICAIATGHGGAIGIVRVSGSSAAGAVNAIFKGADLTACDRRCVKFGQIADPSDGTVIDEVLVTVFPAPHSYTGQDSVEISCHASQYILTRIMELLLDQGCRQAQPGEYTQRAFLNGKMDLSQAESVADLIASDSKASHRLAMQQMRGGYSLKLASLRDELLQLTALLELELDFSEEDVRFADRSHLLELACGIRDEIAHLAHSFHAGNALKNGVPVAIIGAPNVGKSTLLNALLSDDRAIVSEIQGTTRDLIEDTVTIDGILFRFIDTAGIRHTSDTVEQLGIERSISAAAKARIIIMLSEPGVPYPDVPVRCDQKVIRIENKTDAFQAKYGVGLPQLCRQLVISAGIPRTDEILITNLRHFEALKIALEDIRRAIDSMESGLSGDLTAEDLRQCITHLGEITGGQITPDEVLGTIFSRFCIGK